MSNEKMVNEFMENKIELTKSNDLEQMFANSRVEKGVDAINATHDEIKAALDRDYIERKNARTKEADGLEMMPAKRKLIVKPYGYNPYAKIETTESGLIIGDTGAPVYKSNETGQMTQETQGIQVAQVIETFPGSIAEAGDDIFIASNNMLPIPFFNQGFYLAYEDSILTVVGFGISERFKKFENK